MRPELEDAAVPPELENAAVQLGLRNIDVRFGERMVLRGIDLAIAGRGITALMGPSGVGKSTLLRVIAGLARPDAGERRLDGRTAMIFQDARLLPWQTALDNAAFGLRAGGMAFMAARRRAAHVLSRLGIDARDHRKRPAELSGGMGRRVAIARALATEPDWLLLDEPFTGMDVSLRADLQGLLRAVVDERRIGAILVTHDPLEAVALCERVVVLGGDPAGIVADLGLELPAGNAAQAYRAAADLMGRPEIAAAFARPPKAPGAG